MPNTTFVAPKGPKSVVGIASRANTVFVINKVGKRGTSKPAITTTAVVKDAVMTPDVPGPKIDVIAEPPINANTKTKAPNAVPTMLEFRNEFIEINNPRVINLIQ